MAKKAVTKTTARSTTNTKVNQKPAGRSKSRLPLISAIIVALIVAAVGIFLISESQAAPSLNCRNMTFKVGSARHECVRIIQNLMWPNHGLTSGYGLYGSATKSKVANWQKRAGIKDDGITGRDTWGRLCASLRASTNYYRGSGSSYASKIGCIARGGGLYR